MSSQQINKQLSIQGMSCQGCVKKVTRILASKPGLENIQVDLNSGLASFSCSTQTDVPALIQSLADNDFIAHEKI